METQTGVNEMRVMAAIVGEMLNVTSEIREIQVEINTVKDATYRSNLIYRQSGLRATYARLMQECGCAA